MDVAPSRHPTDQMLSSYGLGKLDDRSAEAVNKHLEACPACRERVAEMSVDSFLGRVREAQKGSGKSLAPPPQVDPTQSYSGPKASAPLSADTLPPGLADHPDYEIKRELGRGGMGVVYLAHNKLMGRDEVLKVMGRHIMERPGVLDRFLREIRAVAKLRHPNIVSAYSAVRLGENIVFAMEYVEGLDLSKMVRAKGPLPVAHACNFAYQAALGLQHAHEEGLVHRDIKPHNLMLSRKADKATVKILDFGLAKATREQKVDGGLTHEGQALGTPDYIAPEQILDAPSADVRADIYSLGGTLYYLLTGRPPFEAKSLYDMYQAHISRDADPLNLVRPEAPAELAALVAKMMAKDPARRFQTPGEVAQALAPFFKKATASYKSPRADVSAIDQTNDARPVSTPTQAATNAGNRAIHIDAGAKPTAVETRWESLIDFRDEEPSVEAVPTLEPTRRPLWMWTSVVVGVLTLGLSAAWLGGVFKVKTPEGLIVLENVPKDSEILVDGGKISFTWPGGGMPVEIRAVPGQRKVEVKKEGFTAFAKELTVKTDESQELTVRLDPLVVERPGTKEAKAVASHETEAPRPPVDLGRIEIKRRDARGLDPTAEEHRNAESTERRPGSLATPLVRIDEVDTEQRDLLRREMARTARINQAGPVDRLQPGGVWTGERTYRQGGYAGKTVTYELHIRERDGLTFKGHKFDNGPGRNRYEVEGWIAGETISWLERAESSLLTVRGTIVGDTINLTFKGVYSNGASNVGDGTLTRQ